MDQNNQEKEVVVENVSVEEGNSQPSVVDKQVATENTVVQPSVSQENIVSPANNSVVKEENVQVTTSLPQSQVSVSPTVSEVKTTNNTEPTKGGNFKYFLVFVFFIALIAFVFFLPEISNIIETKGFSFKGSTNEGEKLLDNGILVCTLKKSTDETDIITELDFEFSNRKLIVSEFNKRYESLNSTILTDEYKNCKNKEAIAKLTTGITATCDLTSGILKETEDYVYKDIDTSKLTQYVEAGGTYPEFEYEENIYDIQTRLVKRGYDCETRVKSN